MKKNVFIILLLLTLYSSFADDFPFNIERCSADFKGAAYSEKSVLCYGTGAVVMQSEDNGETWKQYYAAVDTFDILKVKYYNNSYIGVLDKEYMVMSTDEGKNWALKPLAGKDTVVDFDIGNNCFFVLKSNKIEIYDDNFQLTKTCILADTLIYMQFAYFAGKLYFPMTSSNLFIYDYQSGNSELINFAAQGFSTLSTTLINLRISSKGNLYVQQITASGYYSVFESLDSGKTWNIYQKDIYKNYQIFNDDVYHASSEFFNLKTDYEFISFKKNSSNKSSSTPDRLFRNIKLNDLKIIDKNTMLVCGEDKFICISNDGGVTWNLKNQLQFKQLTNTGTYYDYPLGYQCVNDSVVYMPGNYGRVFKTMDGGNNWLTQKYNPEYLIFPIYPAAYFFNENGKGYVVGDPSTTVLHDSIITRTSDYGENFSKMKESKFSAGSIGFYTTKPIKKNDNYYFSQTIKSLDAVNHWYFYCTVICELDSNLNFTGNKTRNDSMKIHSIRKVSDNLAVGIAEETKEPYTIAGKSASYKNWHYWLMLSTDGGFTWNKETNICEGGKLVAFSDDAFLVNNDTAFVLILDSVKHLFIIDLKTKSMESVEITSKIYDFFVLDNKICSSSNGISILNNSTFPPLLENNLSERYTSFSSCTIDQEQNTAYLFARDKKDRLCFVKLTPKIPTSVEEYSSEIAIQHFYAYPPYPLPAQNYVKVKIYWDKGFNMESAKFSVYNVYGAKVSDGSNITLTNSQTYNGELRWDFHSLPAGVYLIKINTKTFQKVIKVLIA